MVRSRAANKVGWVSTTGAFNASTYTYGAATPADKYVVAPYPAGYFTDAATAMKAIVLERRMEFSQKKAIASSTWRAGRSMRPPRWGPTT